MAQTKALALSTAPLAIKAVTSTPLIEVKEDESVANWPTTNLIVKKPDTSGDPNVVTAGKSYFFPAPPGTRWEPGTQVGVVYLPANTTSGVQDEQ
jgi:hypothetical protein